MLVGAVAVAVVSRGYTGRIAECHVRVLFEPRPGLPRGAQALVRISGIEALVGPRGDGHHGREIARGAGTLIRILPRADDVADERVFLRQDKIAEALAGLLVPDTAVVVLHREHPVQVPADFVEDVGRAVAGFRDVELHLLKAVAEQFPSPEQRAGGDAGVDHIAAVVAGVVPSFGGYVRTGLTRRSMISA